MSIIDEYLNGWKNLETHNESWKLPLSYEALLKYGEKPKCRTVAKKRGAMKECYSNAYGYHSRWRTTTFYCEGLAVSSGGLPIPVFHAWTCDRYGNAMEHTWEEPPIELLGIPMRDEFLSKFLVTTGYYGVFDNIWLASKNDKLIHQIQSGEFKEVL